MLVSTFFLHKFTALLWLEQLLTKLCFYIRSSCPVLTLKKNPLLSHTCIYHTLYWIAGYFGPLKILSIGKQKENKWKNKSIYTGKYFCISLEFSFWWRKCCQLLMMHKSMQNFAFAFCNNNLLCNSCSIAIRTH